MTAWRCAANLIGVGRREADEWLQQIPDVSVRMGIRRDGERCRRSPIRRRANDSLPTPPPRRCRSGVVIHQSDHIVPGLVAPENVSFSGYGGVIEVRAECICERRHCCTSSERAVPLEFVGSVPLAGLSSTSDSLHSIGMKNPAVVDVDETRHGNCNAARLQGVCQHSVRILSAVAQAGLGRSTSN